MNISSPVSSAGPTSPTPGSVPSGGASANGGSLAGASQSARSARPNHVPFPSESLKPHLRKALTSRLTGAKWERDKEATKRITKELADGVKGKMIELVPSGYKFVVQVSIVENLGQGGSGSIMPLGRHGHSHAGHVRQ